MSVMNVQIRSVATSLIVVASLLSDVQANPGTSHSTADEHRECGAVSPLFLSLGDAYFDIADTRTGKGMSQEAIAQNELLSRLSDMHRADGSGIRMQCVGSADQLRARLRTVSLEDVESRRTQYADIDSEISVSAYEYDRPARRLVRATVTIPTRPQDVVHLTAQSLETSSRHRQATRKGSYLQETRIDASISDDTITIDQLVYVNGTLAQWHIWHLTE